MKRRPILLAGGAAALAAGAGVAVWRRRAPDPAAEALWQLGFDAPAGEPLAMAAFRGRPLLLNFWATWCAPCVKEMPMLDAFSRAHAAAGWQVVGLAVDGPTPVREFLAARHIGFPIGLAGLDGVQLSRSLGNENGGLPFTVVFDRAGAVRHRKLGALTEGLLVEWTAQST